MMSSDASGSARSAAAGAPIAVIGGGWAGFAAAVTLADRGSRVVVYEAAATAGGRARRVSRAGLTLDNGQHLLLGAYRETQRVLEIVHGAAARSLQERLPLSIVPFSDRMDNALRFRIAVGAGRLRQAAAFLRATGLGWNEKIAALLWLRRLERRGFRCGPGQTVAELLADAPERVAAQVWRPLCIAALNTPVADASAQVFANVLKACFGGVPGQSDFMRPNIDLSALFPDAAATFVTARGGAVRLGTTARLLSADIDGVTIEEGGGGTGTARTSVRAMGAIIAVGPHQLPGAIAPEFANRETAFAEILAAAGALSHEPIATIYLGYAHAVPLPSPICRLDDRPGQWIFERPDILSRATPDPDRPALAQLLAVVISASGAHDALDHPSLIRACDEQLRRLSPGRSACAWSQVVVERRATFHCAPGRSRPPTAQPHARVAIAGDYLDDLLPATLESAVKSGVAAAHAIAESAAKRSGR